MRDRPCYRCGNPAPGVSMRVPPHYVLCEDCFIAGILERIPGATLEINEVGEKVIRGVKIKPFALGAGHERR